MEQSQDNTVQLYGVITGVPSFSHRLYGENFYTFSLKVQRLSEFCDHLPVTASERLLNRTITKGASIRVVGQLRSYNKNIDGTNHLILTVFARQLVKEEPSLPSTNRVQLLGHVCKDPIYRTTPFMREITDLLLAVNRAYGKSDYIPAIVWGRTARFARMLKVGDCVRVLGRFQSREYQKKQDDGSVTEKVAYEVSVSGLERAGQP